MEKKGIRISLSTFFLLIAIIIICVMGFFIYKFYNDKQISNEKVNDLNNQIGELKGTLDNVKNIINSTDSKLQNTETSSNDNVSDDKLNSIAKDLFEKGSNKIRETQYSEYSEYDAFKPETEKNINGKTYRKRNIKYSEVEKEFAKIFTGDSLNKIMNKRFYNGDGYLYVSDGGATGWNIKNIKATKTSENGNKINFKIQYNDINEDESVSELMTCNLVLEKSNNEYRISSTDYCNF